MILEVEIAEVKLVFLKHKIVKAEYFSGIKSQIKNR